jgi:hypothetical protein
MNIDSVIISNLHIGAFVAKSNPEPTAINLNYPMISLIVK